MSAASADGPARRAAPGPESARRPAVRRKAPRGLPRKVLAGGQPGVDRAALDAALDLGFAAGGWTPKGRGTDDGPAPQRYPLTETPGRDPAQALEWNVRDSDATLILAAGRELGRSVERSLVLAHKMDKPVLVVDLLAPRAVPRVLFWLEYAGVSVLHVTGPRESEVPGIRAMAMEFLKDLLMAAKAA